jgi:hypothetical protein
MTHQELAEVAREFQAPTVVAARLTAENGITWLQDRVAVKKLQLA